MTVTDTWTIDVARIASQDDISKWEHESRTANSAALQCAESAMRLLSSDNDTHRRLALLSFRFRWPIDEAAFAQIVHIANGDQSPELRLISLSLLCMSFVRSESRSARLTISEVFRRIADSPDPTDEVAMAARDYLAIVMAGEWH